jgi:hypothetical protein
MNSNRFTTCVLPFRTSENISRLIIKEARIVPHPMNPITGLERFFLPRPLTRKPAKGSKGTNHTSCKILFIIKQVMIRLFPGTNKTEQ